jgi:mitogen-activated protein kinase kinase 1
MLCCAVQAGTYCGTAAYMSPERIQGEPYSFPSDIWSYGLLALEGVTGGSPYPPQNSHFDLVQAPAAPLFSHP